MLRRLSVGLELVSALGARPVSAGASVSVAVIASNAIAAGAAPPSRIHLVPLKSTPFAHPEVHAPALLWRVGGDGNLPCSFAAIESVSCAEHGGIRSIRRT